MIDFFGAFFASPAGRRRNQSVPVSDASASFCARPRVGAEDRRLALRRRRPHHEDVRREQAEDRAAGRARPVVDVDAVAARDVADEAAGAGDRDRDRALLPGELRRDRVGEAGAQVGGRDLLAGEDVRDRDAPVEVRRDRRSRRP